MSAITNISWDRFTKLYRHYPALGLSIDLSRIEVPEAFPDGTMQAPLQRAFDEMEALEKGAIANKDEGRMVGHYWLRNPALAPNPDIRQQIETAVADVKTFVAQLRAGRIQGTWGPFRKVLVVGIGGSALGPQFVSHALGHPTTDAMSVAFLDNTDPDGMDRVFALLREDLGRTLCVVISKSGGTKETRNGMLESKAAYERAGLAFEKHAVAVTGEGSELGRYAQANGWLRQFPMWDWVGGRTSELSVVGLLPAALQGIDIDNLIAGAKACDEITRSRDFSANPAALLAAAWYVCCNGKGEKAMVVLPYKDRLELISKYLQQLVMESLGKELDRDGNPVHQGITVYGNKGSTDQHAYVQQLRDGLANFFATFIEVLEERSGPRLEVEPGTTSGDYLAGFLAGTAEALAEKGRQSLTLTIQAVSPFSVGVLIALYERAVGFYASLVNINAYHQPGVEAGKKAAGRVLDLQRACVSALRASPGTPMTVQALSAAIQQPGTEFRLFKILERLTASAHTGIVKIPGATPSTATYKASAPTTS